MITNYEAAAAILSYYNLPNCPFNAEFAKTSCP